jgi:O-antigen/teichoic acid export membrane protein
MNTPLSPKSRFAFTSARGVSTTATLLFAFWYSALLGVERRGLLTFILTTVILTTVVVMSGFGLSYRNRPSVEGRSNLIPEFLLGSVGLSICSAALSTIATLIYSQQKTNIPNTLLILTFCYAIVGGLDFALHQCLLGNRLFKHAAFIDIFTVAIQIIVFVLLYFSNQVSIAVSVISSLIISYMASVASMFSTLLLFGENRFMPNPRLSFELIRDSRSFQLFALSTNIADRLDRFLIGWLLPISELGRYAVSTSLLTYARFIPDSFSKLIIGGQDILSRFFGRKRALPIALMFFISVAFISAYISQIGIKKILGEIWVLPFEILLCFIVQEILRGCYQITTSKIMISGDLKFLNRLALFLVIASPTLAIVFCLSFGLLGVPLSMCVVYGGLLIWARSRIKVIK